MARPLTDPVVRFWAKVDKSGDCWLWTAAITTNGYGQFAVRHGQRISAHRYAYEIEVGAIGENVELDHLCRVRHCVNPSHLEPVTHAENNRRSDSPSAVNARRSVCERGHPFDAVNTYVRPDGRRNCRACIRSAKSAHRRQSRG